MTYTPQPGDRVTSPLLVGEWSVCERDEQAVMMKVELGGKAVAFVHPEDVTPVTPPLPPEPSLGPVEDDLSNMRVVGNSVTGVTVGDGSPRTKRGHSPACKCAVCQ